MKNQPNLKRLFIFCGLLLIVAFAMIQYSVSTHSQPNDEPILVAPALTNNNIDFVLGEGLSARFTAFDPFEPMPDFPFKTVFDRDKTFDNYKDQWVILNLWATWCPPCIVEMPSLQALQDAYGDKGVKVVAIALDKNMNGKKLRNFMAKHQFGAIAGFYGDGPDALKKFSMRGLPTTYILNPQGLAVGRVSGDFDWIGDEAKAFMDGLIHP
jgi:thiol-disulfide isomerase/thioredoxin